MINNKNNKLEHLVYFQKLLGKLSPNSMNIDNFIQHSFSEILERQYQHDKSKKEVRNRNEFREKYFQVDERTYRRWRNNEVDSIRNDSLPDFRKLSVLKEMYNENHINEFYKQTENQDLNIYLKICYQLRKHTLLLPILEGVLLNMEKNKDLPPIDYWEKLKYISNIVIDMEICDLKQGDLSLPAYSFDRKNSLIKMSNSFIRDKKSKLYIIDYKNLWSLKKNNLRNFDYYQKEIDNEKNRDN